MQYIITGLVVAVTIADLILASRFLWGKFHQPRRCSTRHLTTEELPRQELPARPQAPLPMPGMSMGIPPRWERELNEILFPCWIAQREENPN